MPSTAFVSQMKFNRKQEKVCSSLIKKMKDFHLFNIQDNEDYSCLSVGLLQVRNLLNFDDELIETSVLLLIS